MTASNVASSKVCEHCAHTYAPTGNRSRFCSLRCKVKGQIKADANGCWIWTGPFVRATGYGSTSNGRTSVTAHALAYMAFRGAIPAGMHVCHKCDVRLCVNPDHLFLGTHTENMIDMAKKGRGSRKLTEEQVREIRRNNADTHAALGRRYGVSEVMVAKIRKNEWWKDVGRIE